MKKKLSRAMKVFLVLLFVLSSLQLEVLAPAAQAVTQKEIDALKNDASSYAQQRKALQAEIDKLKDDKEDALAKKALLDQQSAALASQIAAIEGVIANYDLLIEQTEAELAETEEKERAQYEMIEEVEAKHKHQKLFYCDSMGFFAFACAIVLGLCIGKIKIPLPGGAAFSLGTSGGPLIAGLLLGHMNSIHRLSVSVPKNVLETMREFGLALFLLGAGTQAGSGFVEIIKEQGVLLFIYGAFMAMVPMVAGFIMAFKGLKLSTFNSLGSICGGMTSTPALGTLIRVTETDDVASAYAATYPIALVCVVLSSQFMGIYL